MFYTLKPFHTLQLSFSRTYNHLIKQSYKANVQVYPRLHLQSNTKATPAGKKGQKNQDDQRHLFIFPQNNYCNKHFGT